MVNLLLILCKVSMGGDLLVISMIVQYLLKDEGYCSLMRIILLMEIQEAFILNLKSSGKKEEVRKILEILKLTDVDNETIDDSHEKPIKPLTADEAIAVIEDTKLSKEQYRVIQRIAKEAGANIFPSYDNLAEYKKKCYPDDSEIQITDTDAKVNLQKLLDNTVERILTTSESMNVIKDIASCTSFTLITKWGCDGSSGHSTYKQAFSDSQLSDSSVFMVSMVPLELKMKDTEKIIWKNPHPASARYCRPIKFEFTKETREKVLTDVQSIQDDIDNLIPTKICVNGVEYTINHQMHFTMADGKICQYVTETKSAAVCYICGASPKEMNDLEEVKKKDEKIENFKYGLATLHAWIRLMECLIHISYCLPFAKFIARTDEEKILKENKKAEIQKLFREKMGLIVDVVKQGSGTSNDGNTARRFFADPKLTHEITGVNELLIKKFSIILQVITCGYKINIEKFKSFCLETAELYVQLYPWYKILAFLCPQNFNSWVENR